jgi:predicted small lipoprotein YifL
MKKILSLLMVTALVLCCFAGCGSKENDEGKKDDENKFETEDVEIPAVPDLTGVDTSAIPGVEDGVLTVGMECAYAPYNWTQVDDITRIFRIIHCTFYPLFQLQI